MADKPKNFENINELQQCLELISQIEIKYGDGVITPVQLLAKNPNYSNGEAITNAVALITSLYNAVCTFVMPEQESQSFSTTALADIAAPTQLHLNVSVVPYLRKISELSDNFDSKQHELALVTKFVYAAIYIAQDAYELMPEEDLTNKVAAFYNSIVESVKVFIRLSNRSGKSSR